MHLNDEAYAVLQRPHQTLIRVHACHWEVEVGMPVDNRIANGKGVVCVQ